MKQVKTWAALTVLAAASTLASAQNAAPAASAAKKDLIQRLITVTQPEVDALAQRLATQPAAPLVASIQQYLTTQVPQEKREATAKQVDPLIRKYVDEAVPLVREAAVKHVPQAYKASLEENFSEDELRQLVTYMESPVRKKWEQRNPELANALAKKAWEEVSPQLEQKLQGTQKAVIKILETASGKPINPGAGEGQPAKAAPKKK